MSWRALLAPAVLAALAAAGCGGSDELPPSVDEDDRRAVALYCIEERQGLEARPEGQHEILVGDPGTGPRVRLFRTSAEAEATQFDGKAEGTEQIGGALLYVRRGSDEVLRKIEVCLEDL